jgi:FkbM family methyltransferase
MNGLFWNGNIEDNFIGHIMAEVYKDEVYKPTFIGRKNLTIFDLGANIGITSMYFSNYAKDVYSVEPAKEHIECLKKMLEFNKIKNIHPLNYAIAGKNGKLTLNHNPNKTSYSLIAKTSEKDNEEIDAITIEKLFEITGVKHVDFVKMDIEGSEFEVVCGESFRKVAPMIDQIIIEMHQWAGRNFNQLKEALRNNGFKVSTIPNDASIIMGVK